MNRIALRVFFTALLTSLPLAPVSAGIIFQNFEPDNGAPIILNSVGHAVVQEVDRTQAVHLGLKAVKTASHFNWTGFGVQGQVAGGGTNIKQSKNDRLTFWVYALPTQGNDNNVGVTFYDQGRFRNQGFEVWTTQTARYGQWSQLKVLYSQLPKGLDLTRIVKIEFKNFWPGVYYFDDIQAERGDRVYQSFEIEERSGSAEGEYGWKWNSNDTVGLSAPGEPVFEGRHSWKLISTGQWGGTGIQSQEKRLVFVNEKPDQSFWNVDLDPANNDRLTFWVHGLPQNGMDNNMGVQFYDNKNHFTDATKVQVWSKMAATVGQWTKLTVFFKDVLQQASDFDLKDVNKIQF